MRRVEQKKYLEWQENSAGGGEVVEEEEAGGAVDFAAVVEDAVGDGNVGGREDDVVAECLVEYLAGEGDGRGFAFDEKAGGAVFEATMSKRRDMP